MKRKIKETDRVIIPALVDGYGEDRSGMITEIKTFMERKLITVRYDKPDPIGRMYNVVYEHQVVKIKKSKK
jgi:hypothetical protein